MPFFRSLPLAEYGVEWVHPPAALAHPLDDGTAAVLERSVEATGLTLGADAGAYRRLTGPFVSRADSLFDEILGPLRFPRRPLLMARFGLRAVRSARGLAESWFQGEKARALFAGLAAHSILPLETRLTAAVALVLGTAGHAVGWPVARGGSQRRADALAAYLRSLGGEIVLNRRVASLDELPPTRAVLFDVAPRHLSAICGTRLPGSYRRTLGRYRHGPAAFKLDWALGGAIPWRAPECARAATVHLGGTFDAVGWRVCPGLGGQHPDGGSLPPDQQHPRTGRSPRRRRRDRLLRLLHPLVAGPQQRFGVGVLLLTPAAPRRAGVTISPPPSPSPPAVS